MVSHVSDVRPTVCLLIMASVDMGNCYQQSGPNKRHGCDQTHPVKVRVQRSTVQTSMGKSCCLVKGRASRMHQAAGSLVLLWRLQQYLVEINNKGQ